MSNVILSAVIVMTECLSISVLSETLRSQSYWSHVDMAGFNSDK